jgi:hypothetical protein
LNERACMFVLCVCVRSACCVHASIHVYVCVLHCTYRTHSWSHKGGTPKPLPLWVRLE